MGVEHYSDPKLIIQLQRDDVRAFNQIYFKYHTAIYQNIFKLLKDTEESENILQEVFTSLWLNRSTLDAAKPVANWLFVVSYNKSITHLKKSLKKALSYKQIENEHEYDHEADGFLKEIKLQLINEACLNLSPQKRKVFDLCKLQGKSYEETADELNISKHTVKEYLSLAVKSIKEYVDQHPNNKIAGIYLLIIVKMML